MSKQLNEIMNKSFVIMFKVKMVVKLDAVKNQIGNSLAKMRLYKISFPDLIFISACFFECLYHVIQITVYLNFQTKIDISFDSKSQITIPIIDSAN